MLVAVLPIHTLFVEAWISWKPYLILVAILAVADLVEGVRTRSWPWHRSVTIALVIFAVAVLAGWPAVEFRERYVQLFLALGAGALVLLVTERRLRRPGMLDRSLGVIYWTAAAMGISAVLLEVVAVGGFGVGAVEGINETPGIYRFFKPAYLEEGFLALTNWHQDPGYGAAWSVLWAVLAFFAVFRGRGSSIWWIDGMVIGGLAFATVMAFSRTGWVSFLLAMAAASTVVVRRWGVPVREVARRLSIAVVSGVVLVAGVWLTDVPEIGGDLDLQFAFRLQQGWDLAATLTGWFDSTEAFEDRFVPSEERADVWPEYWAFFTEYPLTGVGLGVGWVTTSISQEPHNLFLELAGETGIVGLLAFGLLISVVLLSGAGVVGGVALLAAFLHAMTQTVLFEPTWWFAAGLYLAGRSIDLRVEIPADSVSESRPA